MSQIDNIFIQLRAQLQADGIRLWEEPYYLDGVGSIESEIESLAEIYSRQLSIDVSHCKCVLVELQDNALRKLAARREFDETGVATFKVRRVDNRGGTINMLDVKCDLNACGAHLLTEIANRMDLNNGSHITCISAGRIIAAGDTLLAQGLKNNQQLMVIAGQCEDDRTVALYQRINQIKSDVEAVVRSNRTLVEMEDQDGNAVFLPRGEQISLLTGMGYCEKARVAMHREAYDEALLLLLEADIKFTECTPKFLETVDNYALLNLDIVWCYLCLKNVTQLPDADRRLAICERSFKRSYGQNFERLHAIKGEACAERALIMRLNLLQGVVLFHQNRRDEAYEKLEAASVVLQKLQVDDAQLMLLVEMGFDAAEARPALRSCEGDVDRAIQHIHERREQVRQARDESRRERRQHRRLIHDNDGGNDDDDDWVNPRSVCTLLDMGFERRRVIAALRRTNNDVQLAAEMLHGNAIYMNDDDGDNRDNLVDTTSADSMQLSALLALGFDEPAARVALETTANNVEMAIQHLVRAIDSQDELLREVLRLKAMRTDGSTTSTSTSTMASTSTSKAIHQCDMTLVDAMLEVLANELESYKAYSRFHDDIRHTDVDYLNLSLVQEGKFLDEYFTLLQQ